MTIPYKKTAPRESSLVNCFKHELSTFTNDAGSVPHLCTFSDAFTSFIQQDGGTLGEAGGNQLGETRPTNLSYTTVA